VCVRAGIPSPPLGQQKTPLLFRIVRDSRRRRRRVM